MSRLPQVFAGFLARLHRAREADDRAALAKLRRGVGKPVGAAAERDGWVISRLPSSVRDADLRLCALVSSLFALHPQSGGNGSLGSSFRVLGDRKAASDGPERRFVALLDSHRDDMPDRLRHAVTLLRSEEIAVDWRRLLSDLRFWEHPDRFVQVNWSRDFWSPGVDEPAANRNS